MPLAMTVQEFLGYTEEERGKWEAWFVAHPQGPDAVLQREGRFPSVWDLVDHIFLTERRHTFRLRRDEKLPESTGVRKGDVGALFEFGRHARADLLGFIESAEPANLAVPFVIFQYLGTTYEFSPRKLIFHILMHETRHWAQIATAVRNAGLEPAGFHDLLFAKAMG